MAAEEPANEPVRRPQGRTARVRRQILEATAELIARHGIGGLRYDQVADLAGVNKTSVYRNWPDQNTLIAEALLAFGADVAPLHDSGDIDADLVDYLKALANATAGAGGRALLNAVSSARESPELKTIVDEVFDRRLQNLHDRLRIAVERGELPPVDLTFVGEMLTAPVQLFVTRGTRDFTRDDARRVIAIVLTGVRAIGEKPV